MSDYEKRLDELERRVEKLESLNKTPNSYQRQEAAIAAWIKDIEKKYG